MVVCVNSFSKNNRRYDDGVEYCFQVRCIFAPLPSFVRKMKLELKKYLFHPSCLPLSFMVEMEPMGKRNLVPRLGLLSSLVSFLFVVYFSQIGGLSYKTKKNCP